MCSIMSFTNRQSYLFFSDLEGFISFPCAVALASPSSAAEYKNGGWAPSLVPDLSVEV